jgi:two-component system sensor histidine kinase AtoS
MASLTGDYAQALEAEHLRSDVNRLAKELTELLLGDPNAPADLAALRSVIAQRLGGLRAAAGSPDEVEWLRHATALHDQIEARAGHMQALLERGDREGAFQTSEQEIEKRLLPALHAALDSLRLDYLTRERQALDRAGGAYRQATLLSSGILLLAAGQLAIFALFLQRRFRRPLEIISRGTRRMREGDLDHAIALPHEDELGALAGDITEMARSLRESRERLVRTERLAALGEFAAYLSHNLRNPLAGIRSAAQAALEDPADSQLSRESFQDIIQTVDKLTGWTRDILRYVNPLPPQRAPARPEELVRAVCRLGPGTLAERRVEVRAEVEPGLPALGLDQGAMEQALHALVLNAAEASRPGGLVRIRAARDGADHVAFAVSDAGKGMNGSELAQATRPFYTTKPKGMGLGLAMADQVARAHEGTLRIDSAPGHGTTVTVRLPIGRG